MKLYFLINVLLFASVANFQNIRTMESDNDEQQAELNLQLKDLFLRINKKDYIINTFLIEEDYNEITQLIKHGANPNIEIPLEPFEAKQKSAYTYPLIILASLSAEFDLNFADLIPLFISYGAQVNVVDSMGNTPLIEAVKYNTLKLVEVLLKNGANIDAPDSQGNTPLIIAVKEGFRLTIELLLKYGANVNIKNKKNITALKRAVRDSYLDAVTILLDEKNLNIKDIEESIELATQLKQTKKGLSQRNQIKIEKLLMQRLAEIEQ